MSGSLVRFAASGALLFLVPAAATGAETATPSELILRDLKPIRGLVRNIEIRIERGVSEASPSETHQTAVRGWAAGCCTGNIRRIRARIDGLGKSAETLLGLYRSAGSGDGIRLSTSLASDVGVLREKVAAFAEAPDEPSAGVALQHVVYAVLNVDKDREDLRACCDDFEVAVPEPKP